MSEPAQETLRKKRPAKKDTIGELTAKFAAVEKEVPIKALKYDPNNARKHSDKNVKAVEASLKRWGQLERLIVQKGTGIVIGGNCRLGVMKRLGYTTAKIIEVTVNEAERKALGVALNRTAELASWDEKLLAEALAESQNAGLDEFTGFNAEEVQGMIDSAVAYTKMQQGGNSEYDLTNFDQEPLDESAKRVAEKKRAAGDEDDEDSEDDKDDEEVSVCPHCGKPLR